MAQRRQLVLKNTDVAGVIRTSSVMIDSFVPSKQPVRVYTTGALPANTRTGNVLTASANGVLPAQDGVTLVVGDRIGVKDEATGANNGYFTVTDVGSAGTPWILTRSIDADESAKVISHIYARAEEGTANGGKLFMLTTANPITLNTTALTFAEPPASPATGAHAATIIVDPGGDGDATTIQAGVDLIPTAGGTVYVMEGRYNLTTTISLPTDRHTRIVGSGRRGTIIDLQANAIAAFTFSGQFERSFADFTVEGTNATAGQIVFSIGTTPSNSFVVSVDRVDTNFDNPPEKIIVVASSGGPRVHLNDCKMTVSDLAAARAWDCPTVGGALYLVNTDIVAKANTNNGGGFSGGPLLMATNSKVTIGGDGTIGTGSRLVNSEMVDGILTFSASRVHIIGCVFQGGTKTRRINITGGTDARIIGCTFTAGTTDTMQTAADDGFFAGNQNFKVTETAAADNNRYADNEGFTGSVLEANATVDGVQMGSSATINAPASKANLNTTGVGNVLTGEDDLITYSLPADSLSRDGAAVKIKAWGTTANNANAKTLRLKIGTATLLTTSLTTGQAGFWEINAVFARTALDAQDFHASLIEFPGTLHDIEQGTAVLNDGAAQTIKCTGDATATDDIRQEGMLVEYMG